MRETAPAGLWGPGEEDCPIDPMQADGLPTGGLRRAMYALRRGVRDLQRDRIAACGYAKVADRLGIVRGEGGRAAFAGLQHCGSVWECAVCHAEICFRRASEIGRAVERWGIARCAMLTLTIRHGFGDDLRLMRERLARAWQSMIRGAPWQRFKVELGIEGTVRALEVTHGREHGWHPHLHVLLLLRHPIADCQVLDVERPNGTTVRTWLPVQPVNAFGWLIDRWADCVGRMLGDEHVPNEHYGVTLTPCTTKDYLAKLGLEVADPGFKSGQAGRTPWQIGDEYRRKRKPEDADLWRAYCAAMKGAKQLTWSAGLRRKLHVVDRPDHELAVEECAPNETLVAVLDTSAWKRLRDSWRSGAPLAYLALVAAEDGALAAELGLSGLRERQGVWSVARGP